MSFEIKGVSAHHFKEVDRFFRDGSHGAGLEEFSQKISHTNVDGSAAEWYFDGIRMGFSDWHYKKPVDLEWRYDIKVQLVTFQVNLKGFLFMNTAPGRTIPVFSSNQHNLFYSDGDSNEGILKPDRLRASMFFMQFTRDAFLRLTGDANDALNRFSENVANGQAGPLSFTNMTVDAYMLNLIKNIVNCAYKGNLKKMYLLSKCIEFLVLQAEACNAATAPSYKYARTAYDRDRVMYAREYLLSHLETPPSLSELARITGINEYKLKRGFKEMFGNTVFGYLSDMRLEMAKNDLLQTQKSAAEIASMLGYASPQHFSYAFKRKFGVPPGRMKGD